MMIRRILIVPVVTAIALGGCSFAFCQDSLDRQREYNAQTLLNGLLNRYPLTIDREVLALQARVGLITRQPAAFELPARSTWSFPAFAPKGRETIFEDNYDGMKVVGATFDSRSLTVDLTIELTTEMDFITQSFLQFPPFPYKALVRDVRGRSIGEVDLRPSTKITTKKGDRIGMAFSIPAGAWEQAAQVVVRSR